MAKQITTRKKTAVNQTFSFKAPGAVNVMLVGDFTHWQKNPITLHKEPDGIWRVTVPLKPGEHRYRFLVDGEWRDDPECALRVPNPFGSQDAVVKVSASTTRQ
jgi:1,4-alpha-glucan branching enzyme